MLKAIETSYKGYLFRSRLEARWAVFFDALGLDWEYEPEGFELPDGTRYLPDFRLPKVMATGAAWLEVKPIISSDTWPSIKRAIDVAIAANTAFILAVGMPDRSSMLIVPNAQNTTPAIPWDQLPTYADAYAAARSARFEYGPMPTSVSERTALIDKPSAGDSVLEQLARLMPKVWNDVHQKVRDDNDLRLACLMDFSRPYDILHEGCRFTIRIATRGALFQEKLSRPDCIGKLQTLVCEALNVDARLIVINGQTE